MCRNSIFSKITSSEWNRMLQCFQPIVQSFEAGEYIMTFSEHLERIGILPVSYTHLDVYKRQRLGKSQGLQSNHGTISGQSP